MKLQYLALPLLVALMFSPMLASAATGTITFSSPAAGASYSGTTAYTISGTITPTPTLPDNVVITVTQQGGSTSPLDEATVAVGAGGTFSYSTNVGGSAAWVTGTYVISAFDSNGATGTTTIKYTGTTTTTTGVVTIEGPSLVLPGQSANVWIYSSSPGAVTAWVLPAGSTTTTSLTATRVTPNPGGLYVYSATYTVAATAANGVYLVGALVTNSSTSPAFGASNIGSFTVNGGVANATSITSVLTALTSLTGLGKSVTSLNSSIAALTNSVNTISTNVNSINTAVASLGTSVGSLTTSLGTITSDVQGIQTTLSTISSTIGTLSTSVSSISTNIGTLTTDVTTMQGTVNTLTGLATDMTNLQNSVSSLSSSVSNAQTYILVVAALAVITLVLELAILIRKMS